MYYILIFILGFLAGAGVMWARKKAGPSAESNIINPAQVKQHQENLQKISEWGDFFSLIH